jgi:hypothetical protein
MNFSGIGFSLSGLELPSAQNCDRLKPVLLKAAI